MLAEVALALCALDNHAGVVHLIADATQQGLDTSATEHRVIDVVKIRGGEIAVAVDPGFFVSVEEDDELEFGADEGAHACGFESIELLLEYLARRGNNRVTALPQHVAEHADRTGLPRDAVQ